MNQSTGIVLSTAINYGGSTSFKSPAPKLSTIDSPRLPSTKKSAYGASMSNQ
jgi:hypothetical protein